MEEVDQNLISSSSEDDSLGKDGFKYPRNEGAFSNSDNQEEEKHIIMDSLDSERRERHHKPDDMTFDNDGGGDQGESA